MAKRSPPPVQVFRKASSPAQSSSGAPPASSEKVFRRQRDETPRASLPEKAAPPSSQPATPERRDREAAPPRAAPPSTPVAAQAQPAPPAAAPSPALPARPAEMPPPTEEVVAALARSERVPPRVARAELLGKDPCRVWKQKNPALAAQAAAPYHICDRLPGVPLKLVLGLLANVPEVPVGEALAALLERCLAYQAQYAGFSDEGALRAGLGADAQRLYQSERARAQLEKARGALVAREALGDGPPGRHLQTLVSAREEVAVVTVSQTRLGRLEAFEPRRLILDPHGPVKKSFVYALGSRAAWRSPDLEIGDQPDRLRRPQLIQAAPQFRPVLDPRPFLEVWGRRLALELRNGLVLRGKLVASGGYDLLVGGATTPVWVPIHALNRYEVDPA